MAEPDVRGPGPNGPFDRIAALAEIAHSVEGAMGYDDVLMAATRAARRALEGASASLSIWERDLGRLRTLVNDGELASFEVPRPDAEYYWLREDHFLTELVTTRRGYVGTVGETPDASLDALLRESGKGSGIDVPVVVAGHVWGDLWVTRTAEQPEFTPADLDFAYVVAAQVAGAVVAGERIEQIARLAFTDPLTGLANRRVVDERLDDAMQAHRARGAGVGLVVCDINGLKAINDEQGHDEGDRVLVQLAGLLSSAAAQAPGAVAARLGGDEFCVLVVGQESEAAVRVADELCRRALDLLPQGVSCGVACAGGDAGPVPTPSRLFRLADAAQYRAKRSGLREPVVAGRGLPADTLRMSPPPPEERRQLRGRTHVDPVRVLVSGLAGLDELAGLPVRQRVEAVADELARAVDASGWWVSQQRSGDDAVETVNFSLYRATPSQDFDRTGGSAIGARFAVADFPLTARALDGAVFVVETSDPHADPAEVAIVEASGCVALLVAGVRDAAGDRWLVEVFADAISDPLRDLVAVTRSLLAVAAIGSPG